jgi:hypothetical protein
LQTYYALLLFWLAWSAEFLAVDGLGLVVFAAGFAVLVYAVLRPRPRAVRIAAFLAVAVAHYLMHSAGRIGNASYPWPLSALLMVALSEEGAELSPKDEAWIRAQQGLILAPYFLAGVWRLWSCLHAGSLGAMFAAVVNFPMESLAYAVAQGHGPPLPIRELMMAHPGPLAAGFLLSWAFELTAFVPLLKPRWLKIWGLSAVAFHSLTGIFLAVYFVPMILSTIFFLLLADGFLRAPEPGR